MRSQVDESLSLVFSVRAKYPQLRPLTAWGATESFDTVGDKYPLDKDSIAVRLLEPEFEVVGTVADGNSLVRASAHLKPDVCVIDISMPQLNGIEAAIQLRESGSTTRIVFLTVNEDSDFVRAALRTGALGYVIKSRMANDLCAAVNGAIGGQLFVSPSCIFSADPDQLKPLV